ncbi:hypothetical protein B0H14DRAFT_3469599 [Mycena olivaceomarginata]|nr:hypothetical protein B0H14DRAFT_3469599 [Mycena olivaceomarginata]
MRLSLILTSTLPPLAALGHTSTVVMGSSRSNVWRFVVHMGALVRRPGHTLSVSQCARLARRAATVVWPSVQIECTAVRTASFALYASRAFARGAAHRLLTLVYLPALPSPLLPPSVSHRHSPC